jgi:hypothetical protein
MKALFQIGDKVQLPIDDVMYRVRESIAPNKKGAITGKVIIKYSWRNRESQQRGGCYEVELDEAIGNSKEVARFGDNLEEKK